MTTKSVSSSVFSNPASSVHSIFNQGFRVPCEVFLPSSWSHKLSWVPWTIQLVYILVTFTEVINIKGRGAATCFAWISNTLHIAAVAGFTITCKAIPSTHTTVTIHHTCYSVFLNKCWIRIHKFATNYAWKTHVTVIIFAIIIKTLQ